MNTPEKKNYKYKPSPEEIFHFIQNNLMTEAYDFYKVGKFIKILPAPDRIEMPPGEILNRIKELLDDKRIKEIEGLDRDKPILIIGKDTNKVDLIVSYIHLTHPTVQRKDKFDMFEVERLKRGYVGRIRFSSIDYTGRNELYIENDLFVTRKFKDSFGGVMLFLRGISGECKGIFEHIASVMRDKKYDYGKKVVIISTDNLQQKPSDGFEVIELEPEKQSENSGIPQDKTAINFVPFPTPAGTGWHEVEISFIDSENVKISAKNVTKNKHYSEIGFKDNRRYNKPVESWNTLLSFKEKERLTFPHTGKEKTGKSIQDLRKRLKAYFGIQDNPIILEHGYKPKFKVSTYENQSRSVYAFSNSDSFNENEDD